MVQLSEDLGVVLVDTVGYLPETGDHLAVVDVDELLVGPVGGVNAHLFGDDETGSPPGPLPPVVHLGVAGETVHGQIGQVRLKGDPVFNLHLADLQGGEERGKHHGITP